MQHNIIQWRVVPQYSRYEVSTHGQVRARFACDRHPENWILSPRKFLKSGYPQYRVIGDDGKRRCVYLHFLVIRAFHGDKPFPEAVCRHLDGNSLNNHPNNLRWGTVHENILDAIRHGTFKCQYQSETLEGSLASNYREYWRGLRKLGWSNPQIARMYGCHHTLVSQAILGKA